MIELDDMLFRAGSSAVDIPKECGKVISLFGYQDLLVLACENGVWTYDPNMDEFRKRTAFPLRPPERTS